MHMLDKMTFIPRGNNVLIDRIRPEDKSYGGVIIPDVAKEQPLMGKVLAMGPGKEKPHDCRQEQDEKIDAMTGQNCWRFEPMADLAVGDIVFFNLRASVPCNTRESGPDCMLVVVDADQILAVVKINDPERN